jgi:hypothetical protein
MPEHAGQKKASKPIEVDLDPALLAELAEVTNDPNLFVSGYSGGQLKKLITHGL